MRDETKYRKLTLRNEKGEKMALCIPLYFCRYKKNQLYVEGISEQVYELEKGSFFHRAPEEGEKK